MPRYAQINLETGCVVSDSHLNETSAPNLIQIENDFVLANKKWDFESEAWVEYVPESEEPAEGVTWEDMTLAIASGVNDV